MGLLIVFGLIMCVSAQNNDIIETYENGRRVCKQNCGYANGNGCPNVPCPRPDPPALDRSCPVINCNTPFASWVLWPIANDPTSFYKCRAIGVWNPEIMACGCATLFDYASQRCVHPHEWRPQCNQHTNPNPPPRACPICDTCNDPNDPFTTTTPPPNNNNCPCPCSPCIMFPCRPCGNNCPCTGTTPIVVPTVSIAPPQNCPCVCAPCVMWPCAPCPSHCCRGTVYDGTDSQREKLLLESSESKEETKLE